MKIIATICSRHKNPSAKLLPARERYTGEHVREVERISKEVALPFYILSGKYGLLSAEENIPDYDYYLEEEAVEKLAKLLCEQLKGANVTEVHFYKEDKDSWAPYLATMQRGVELAEIELFTHTI